MMKYFAHNRIVLILILCSIFLFTSCGRKKENLPEKVGDLILVKKITGTEAKDYINKLHLQPVTENENIIAHYENLSGSAVVYVTIYANEKDAEKDFERMTNKISPENSVFIYPEFFNYANNKIYKCFGMGMTHYVFSFKNNLYWISVDTHIARVFFESFYNQLNQVF